MPNHKHIVPVDKDAKRLNRIFDDLAVHGECLIDSDNKEWAGTIRKYSRIIKSKHLENEFIEPMWIQSSKETRKVERRLIRLKPHAVIEKNMGNGKTYFKFKRRRLI